MGGYKAGSFLWCVFNEDTQTYCIIDIIDQHVVITNHRNFIPYMVILRHRDDCDVILSRAILAVEHMHRVSVSSLGSPVTGDQIAIHLHQLSDVHTDDIILHGIKPSNLQYDWTQSDAIKFHRFELMKGDLLQVVWTSYSVVSRRGAMKYDLRSRTVHFTVQNDGENTFTLGTSNMAPFRIVQWIESPVISSPVKSTI